ncbi:MAG: hypothetical protein RL693_17 [Verrucomicrobiota bacterium]
MKLTLTNINHVPSASLIEMLEAQLKSLQPDLQIDEARVRIEHLADQSPPFHMAIHLVTPGPDILVEAKDHTLRAAMLKSFEAISLKMDHRHLKRAKHKDENRVRDATQRTGSGGKRR